MKKVHFFLFIYLLFCQITNAQDCSLKGEVTGSGSFNYSPSGVDGRSVNGNLSYKIFGSAGTTFLSTVITVNYPDNVITLNGKRYSSSDIGEDAVNNVKMYYTGSDEWLNTATLTADVYSDGIKITNITLDKNYFNDIADISLTTLLGPEFCRIIKNNFQLQNFQLHTPSFKGITEAKYVLNEKIEKEKIEKLKKEEEEKLKKIQADLEKKKKQEYDLECNSGDVSFKNGLYEEALQHYNNAKAMNPNASNLTNLNNQIALCEGAINKGKEDANSKVIVDQKEKNKIDESKESAAEVKKQEEEAKKAEKLKQEEEQRRLEQAEKERLERHEEYLAGKEKQRTENMEMGTNLAVQALLVHYMIAKFIYQDAGEDTYKNVFKDDNYKLSFNAGYSFTSLPMYFNSSTEHLDYEGVNKIYTDETENLQATTLDLQGGAEIWPLYGKKMGLGAFGSGGAGHGLLFQQFTFFGQTGLRAYVGFENFKLFSELSIGYRKVTAGSWLDPYEYGPGGKTKYTYQRLKIGPRISFNCNFLGKTRCNLDILPMFELPSFKESKFYTPLNIRWLNGIAVNMSFDNRLNFFSEILWNYQRSGDVSFSYDKNATFAGVFFKLGVLRNFDYFGESTSRMDSKSIDKFKKQKSHKSIIFFSPSFGWNKESTGLLSLRKPNIGIRISYEHDFYLFSQTNLTAGLGLSYNSGGLNSNNTTGNKLDVQFSSIMIPISLRTYLNENKAQKYWISYGFNNHISLLQKTEGTENNYGPTNTSQFKRYIPSLQIGGGIDYKISNTGALRVGLLFENSLSPFYTLQNQITYGYGSSTNSSYSLKNKQLTIQLGYLF